MSFRVPAFVIAVLAIVYGILTVIALVEQDGIGFLYGSLAAACAWCAKTYWNLKG